MLKWLRVFDVLQQTQIFHSNSSSRTTRTFATAWSCGDWWTVDVVCGVVIYKTGNVAGQSPRNAVPGDAFVIVIPFFAAASTFCVCVFEFANST
eukprot:m.32379 g.32379  ORF g.32379 m.32379 type:complete len:94 (+) comp16633_c1_seq1:82-363(+)